MRNTKFLITGLFTFFQLVSLPGEAQEMRMSIGQKTPDFQFNDILFYEKPSLKLSDLKGKLVILDFWATNCSPCVAAMPKYDALQKKFGDKIAILPVVSSSGLRGLGKEGIRTFWKKNSFTSKTSLPTVIDTVLEKYFPHEGVPYEVWINGDGVLVGLTKYVDEQEINSVLSGNFVKSVYKGADAVQFSVNDPMLELSNEQAVNKVWYTAITPYIKTTSNASFYEYDSVNNTTRFSVINRNIFDLLRIGYFALAGKNYNNYSSSRIILEVKDTKRYINPDRNYPDVWNRENTYSYDAVMPGKLSHENFCEKMAKDAVSFFNLDARFEKRTVDCWALVRTSTNDGILISQKKEDVGKKRGADFPDNIFYAESVRSVTHIITTSDALIESLNYWCAINEGREGFERDRLNVINESGITQNIRLVLDMKVKDGKIENSSYAVESIKPQLKQYGLDLVKVKRELDVFVITEKGDMGLMAYK